MSEKEPIISIITPYYNAQNFIEETAKSVLSQTFKDFEWIIVDDGSSRKGIEKLKKISKLDNRIKVIFQKTTQKNLYTNGHSSKLDTSQKSPSTNRRSCSGKRFWDKKVC